MSQNGPAVPGLQHFKLRYRRQACYDLDENVDKSFHLGHFGKNVFSFFFFKKEILTNENSIFFRFLELNKIRAISGHPKGLKTAKRAKQRGKVCVAYVIGFIFSLSWSNLFTQKKLLMFGVFVVLLLLLLLALYSHYKFRGAQFNVPLPLQIEFISNNYFCFFSLLPCHLISIYTIFEVVGCWLLVVVLLLLVTVFTDVFDR